MHLQIFDISYQSMQIHMVWCKWRLKLKLKLLHSQIREMSYKSSKLDTNLTLTDLQVNAKMKAQVVTLTHL